VDDILGFLESEIVRTWWWVVIPVAVLFYIIWDWVNGDKSRSRVSKNGMEYQDYWLGPNREETSQRDTDHHSGNSPD